MHDTLSITDFAYPIDRGRLVTSGTPAKIGPVPAARWICLGEGAQA